jgi:hypothetical protein
VNATCTAAILPPPAAVPVDDTAVTRIAVEIGGCVCDYQVQRIVELGGPSRSIVYETLNALAFNAAAALAGTDRADEALQFFHTAVERNLSAYARDGGKV